MADNFQADRGVVESTFHDLAIGQAEGDRRSAAPQGSRTQQFPAHQAHLSPGIRKYLGNPLLAGTAYPTGPEMQLAMFANLAYCMLLEDCQVHQDLCDPTGQAVLRRSCLEPCSGFIRIKCTFAHSHGCDGGVLLIWRAWNPRLWRPAATGASLGLWSRRSLQLTGGELVPQLLDLHHHLSVALPVTIDLTMLPGIMTSSLVTLRDLVGVALEVLRLLPVPHLAARVIMTVITIPPVADIAAALAVWSALLLAVLAN